MDFKVCVPEFLEYLKEHYFWSWLGVKCARSRVSLSMYIFNYIDLQRWLRELNSGVFLPPLRTTEIMKIWNIPIHLDLSLPQRALTLNCFLHTVVWWVNPSHVMDTWVVGSTCHGGNYIKKEPCELHNGMNGMSWVRTIFHLEVR